MNPTANYPFNVKAAEDDGVFEGYASVFDIMDDGRDSIAPGAFARSLAQKAHRQSGCCGSTIPPNRSG